MMHINGLAGLQTSVLVGLLSSPVYVDAALFHQFADQSAFLSATNATSSTGTIPNLGKVANAGVAKSLSGVSFTAIAPSIDLWFGRGGGTDWTSLLPGNEIAIGERENLDVLFAGPVFAAGFDFAEPTCASGCAASTFAITLRDTTNSIVGTFEFAPKQDIAQFFGVWSDTSFILMQIREILPPDSSNEYFGQFYTSNRQVPEPSVMLLLTSSLFGLAGLLWHRLRKASRS